MSDRQVHLNGEHIPVIKISWKEMVRKELEFYLFRLSEIQKQKGTWVVPLNHIVHHKDGALTQHSSWARQDCIDNQLTVPINFATEQQIKEGNNFELNNSEKIEYKITINSKMPADIISPYAHHLPTRHLMSGEFAEHNHEYYFWCPKINI